MLQAPAAFVRTCASTAECAEFVDLPLRTHLKNLRPRSNGTMLRACRGASERLDAGYNANASSRAEATMAACSKTKTWSRDDARYFLRSAWLPTRVCRSLTRLGPSYNNTRESDGGKTVCDALELLHAPGPCTVVSVGLKDDTRFESGVHHLAPHCTIHGFDGTLSRARAARLPPYIVRHANFESTSWQAYAAQRVRILKIDCKHDETRTLEPSKAAAQPSRSHRPGLNGALPARGRRRRVRAYLRAALGGPRLHRPDHGRGAHGLCRILAITARAGDQQSPAPPRRARLRRLCHRAQLRVSRELLGVVARAPNAV